MACACAKKRRPMVGQPSPVRASAPVDAAITAAATTGAWATSCTPGESFRSLLRAQRAAKACGGRVIPA